jgi:acyl carrier protein
VSDTVDSETARRGRASASLRRDEILTRVRDVLCREFDLALEAVVPTARLAEDLDLDSIDAVALAAQLEQETGLLLKEERLQRMRTVQDVVDVVIELQGQQRV